MPLFAMSSFSIKEITGPIAFSLADAEAVVHRVELGLPAEFAVADLPARVGPAFGLDAVETVGLHWDDADAGSGSASAPSSCATTCGSSMSRSTWATS